MLKNHLKSLAFAAAAAVGLLTMAAPEAAAVTVSLAAAGDSGDCRTTNDNRVGNRLKTYISTNTGPRFVALGDNAYTKGTLSEYNNCYHPGYGHARGKTKAVIGNHEVMTAGAAGFFGYYPSTGDCSGAGYCAQSFGDWLLVFLNTAEVSSAGLTATQLSWLNTALANDTRTCVMVFGHHPRFSTGFHGNNAGANVVGGTWNGLPSINVMWDILYDHKVTAYVAGHDHNFEQFRPQNKTGVHESTRGVRQFVIGTGGTQYRSMTTPNPDVDSQARFWGSYGFMEFALNNGSYSWVFRTAAGPSQNVSGSGNCVT
jgi:hypothetical protein